MAQLDHFESRAALRRFFAYAGEAGMVHAAAWDRDIETHDTKYHGGPKTDMAGCQAVRGMTGDESPILACSGDLVVVFDLCPPQQRGLPDYRLRDIDWHEETFYVNGQTRRVSAIPSGVRSGRGHPALSDKGQTRALPAGRFVTLDSPTSPHCRCDVANG